MTKTPKWLEPVPVPLHQWLNGRKVNQVACVVADIAGGTRGKTVVAEKFSPSEKSFMADSIFYQNITGSNAATANQWGWHRAMFSNGFCRIMTARAGNRLLHRNLSLPDGTPTLIRICRSNPNPAAPIAKP